MQCFLRIAVIGKRTVKVLFFVGIKSLNLFDYF